MLYLQTKKLLCKQVIQKAKKLMAVWATSTSIIGQKNEEELERIPCIWYPITFKDLIEALLDSKNKVNVINQAFAS